MQQKQTFLSESRRPKLEKLKTQIQKLLQTSTGRGSSSSSSSNYMGKITEDYAAAAEHTCWRSRARKAFV